VLNFRFLNQGFEIIPSDDVSAVRGKEALRRTIVVVALALVEVDSFLRLGFATIFMSIWFSYS